MAAVLDDYGNAITNEDGSNWQPSDTPPTDSTTVDTSAGQPAADPIDTYDFIQRLTSFISSQQATYTDSAMSDTEKGQALMAGAGSKNAPTPTGEKGFLGGALDWVKNAVGWENMDDRTKAAAITVGGGLIAGLGKGYADSKKLALEERHINTQDMLAQTQADILQKKAANQNFSGFTFNQPVDANGKPVGIINSPAKITPLKQRVTQ